MSKIQLHVISDRAPYLWEEAVEKAPRGSIFLDGACKGKTQFDADRLVFNFNHHEEVDRLSTRCTAAQVLMAIRLGLFERLRNEKGEIDIHVFVNDSDQDVCLSVFLLKHSHLAEHAINPAINRLVSMEDFLDTTSGAYPFPRDLEFLEQMSWIFEPYTLARKVGMLHSGYTQVHSQIIDSVIHRILQYVTGNGKSLKLDMEYEVLHREKGWAMVNEIGDYARTAIYASGIKAFVSVKERADGKYQYVIGKISPYIPFDIEAIFERLNEVEGTITSGDSWGGGDIIGGSPRVSGSTLTPQQVRVLVEEVCNTKKELVAHINV